MAKYLDRENILADIRLDLISPDFIPLSTDSYNEEAIKKRILALGNPPELIYCAINFAIVGYGNKKYGSFKLKGDIIDIKKILEKYKIKSDNPRNAQLDEFDLTPQRLCRFYRYHIQNYIKNNNSESYLFRKYSTKQPKFRDICFRGAEYINELTEEQFDYLLKATKNMDSILNTTISERLLRVQQAKKQTRQFV